MKCNCCGNQCIKKGFQELKYVRKQRYYCKTCKRYQLEYYHYQLYKSRDDRSIISLLSKGMSITSISKFLGYSKQTIGRRILYLSKRVHKPEIVESDQVYEVDELWTYVGNMDNDTWISYAINRTTKRVVCYSIGSRSKKDISPVIEYVNSLNPKKIVTDKLNLHPNIVRPTEHDTRRYRNNRIERSNLTLREHLRRLTRKTISYSKSIVMLEATFKLYLYWNNWVIDGE